MDVLTNYCKNSSYYAYNYEQCIKPTFFFNEFLHDFNNPFSMNYINWFVDPKNISNISGHEKIDFNMYYFIICYAYSLFRIIIDVAVIIYAIKATHEVSQNKIFFSINERNKIKRMR